MTKTFSPKTRALLSASARSRVGARNGAYGKHWKLSPETRARQSAAQRGESNSMFGRRGDLCPAFRNAPVAENTIIRRSLEYREWRRQVFERDDYTCQDCGARSGNGEHVELHADHVKPFALHPELRFDIENGRTLCAPCHRKTSTFAGRTRITSLQ